MKKSLLFFVVLFAVANSGCSTKKPQHLDDLGEVRNFLQEIYQQELKDRTSVLRNEPSKISFNDISKESFFSATDLAEIETALKNRKITNWEDILGKEKRYIRKAEIDTIFAKKDPAGGWSYVYAHVGKKIATISEPVFFRNKTLCLFYTDYSCGWLCGYGELNVYEKKKGKWVKLRTFSSWVS